ncbi:sulfur oxidation protein SoxY [Prosthecochloris sp. CIB 2401]|uniref:Thiosulfate-binding protein SoxY n=2 Tax=Chlorobiaceae TaxID=191412 RepID=A0A5C4S3A0_PROVB|nr:sulfur oxidation protein SoxY [Prosthecochloris sp. CIB 2401]TNJ37648.1 thiosulfate-binding protein SoxY [Prosthecochloris vibrioformis]
MKRREFLRGIVYGAAAVAVMPAYMKGAWSTESFTSEGFDVAIRRALGGAMIIDSDAVTVTAPEVATNSSVVPLEVSADMEVDQMFLFVEKNSTPLVYRLDLKAGMLPWFSIRVKMRESSAVHAIVRSGGIYYRKIVTVEVTSQAC